MLDARARKTTLVPFLAEPLGIRAVGERRGVALGRGQYEEKSFIAHVVVSRGPPTRRWKSEGASTRPGDGDIAAGEERKAGGRDRAQRHVACGRRHGDVWRDVWAPQ